jgi:hypothetical protein
MMDSSRAWFVEPVASARAGTAWRSDVRSRRNVRRPGITGGDCVRPKETCEEKVKAFARHGSSPSGRIWKVVAPAELRGELEAWR